jgi:uncharacterized caspase-like protein
MLIPLLNSSPALAREYTWDDFSQPFTKSVHTVGHGQAAVIYVSLPESFQNYEEIPLMITAIQEDPIVPTRKFLAINDASQWDAYLLPIPEGKEVTIRVNVKTKLLKTGQNKFKFTSDAHSSQYGLDIKTLRFDLTGKSGFDRYMASRRENSSPAKVQSAAPEPQETKASAVKEHKAVQKKSNLTKDNQPPEIILTSHDISRGMKVVQNEKKITITGRAKDSSGIVEVIVDNKEAYLDKDGNFKAESYLKIGENRISIAAIDRYGNQSTQTFTIIRKNNEQTRAQKVAKSSSANYYALVIGNNDYDHLPKLQTARKDAKQVATALADRYHFQTKLLLDATRDDILRAMNNFRKRLKENDSFLIYYAGHGEFDQTTSKAYWLPVNARSDEDTDWIIVDTITSNIKRISSKHILIVSDSCYSGTLTRSAVAKLDTDQARHRYLEKMRGKKSRTLLASGGNEPVSDSGGNGHSVFAAALLQGLKDMDRQMFTAEELFYSHIKERVAGNAEQIPEYNIIRNSGHDGGDFIFRRAR